eukprot:CAMPEP_0170080692 /NCGR_PEP_ID=MMETSP0019_2-20121128/16763_1 /TAXON_ID=98059 /ORGANISM="Dinobryon sp., Strain UTEXLB2267" /LENGTH=458 /DNA_ID=CAMNT_0010294783 /DNA_START=78 /DNA_END=1451 /DNA_ORIENTATION=-
MNRVCEKFRECTDKTILSLVKSKKPHSRKLRESPNNNIQQKLIREGMFSNLPFGIILSHEICNFAAPLIEHSLDCVFNISKQEISNAIKSNCTDSDIKSNYAVPGKRVKELFLVREPLSRAISVYYFWGELFKMRQFAKRNGRNTLSLDYLDFIDNYLPSQDNLYNSSSVSQRQLTFLLGKSGPSTVVDGHMFKYHGDESTSPPKDLAISFASSPPLRAGMPGPSYSWSAFADSVKEAVAVLESNRMITLVIERLDESLVAAAHFLGWSLADMVITVPRKSLSSHPKHSQWPPEAVSLLRARLIKTGEYQVYEAAVKKLDERLEVLERQGVAVKREVEMLQMLRNRSTEICGVESYLKVYRLMLQNQGYPTHPANNKLRDVSEELANNGHLFSYNKEILGSFDICGSCEAHALLWNDHKEYAYHKMQGFSLKELLTRYPNITQNDVNFKKCPSKSHFM